MENNQLLIHDLFRWNQDSTDYPYNICTVNLIFDKILRPRFFKTKKFGGCRDQVSLITGPYVLSISMAP